MNSNLESETGNRVGRSVRARRWLIAGLSSDDIQQWIGVTVLGTFLAVAPFYVGGSVTDFLSWVAVGVLLANIYHRLVTGRWFRRG